jgi:hypothetical protein
MDVRQATLLKLYGKDITEDLAKETILYIFEHGLDLLGKDVCNNFRMIRGGLLLPRLIRIIIVIFIGEQIVFDLKPTGIGGHGEKDIWLSTMSSDGHRVLKELIHVTGATRMGGGQDDTLAHLVHVCILHTSQTISQTIVEIGPDGLLIMPDPIQLALLYRGPSVDNILLKQPAPSKEI